MLIPVMFNKRYGGFGFSDAAVAEYLRRTGKTCADEDRYFHYNCGALISRTDTVMIQILAEMGEAANGQYATLATALIDARHKDFYYIGEYDGYERVNIDYQRYALARLKEVIVDSDLSLNDKVQKATSILTKEERRRRGGKK